MSVSTSTELSGSGDIAEALVVTTVLAAVEVNEVVVVKGAAGAGEVPAERRSLCACAPLGVSVASTSLSSCK